MSWHAIDSLDDAREATADLLLPFALGTWLRLALVVVFVGAGASNVSVNANVGGSVTPGAPAFGAFDGFLDGMPPIDPGTLPDARTLAYGVAAVAAVVVLLALVFSLVAAVMEFVLVTALADRTVRVRRPFRERFGKGLRLFGFEAGVLLLALLVVGAPAAVVLLGGVSLGPAALVALLPVLLLGVAVALLVALLFRLTADFVVPTMLAADCGVVDGWRRLAPTLRTEWEEFALYVVIRVSAGVIVGAVFAAATLFVAVLVALPFVLVGGAIAVAAASAGGLSLLGWALLGVVAVGYLATVALASAFVLVPVVVFLRYYALYVLGRLDPGLDLVGASSQGVGEGSDDGDGESDDDGPDGAVAA
ncbi:hypothetical protein SAMN04487947_1454 [Halogeometricum rufum]|uniref:Membrane domain of glycerophosphoryl diester phosphodiesterase n=1 Tax=Halogeometricum rufum TaxID=553469 RepID=A0A1I6GPD1_9EURY|nr:hypothetical protein [Halogeometricum rufum]SFR43917.1 hypothetical protein SAMN04487947_1454 [Halogeometricum rufum]